MLKFNRDFPGRILPNEEFSKRIKIVWEQAFKSENLISGFRSTGIFPVDFHKFPEEAYDIFKLQKFKDYERQKKPTSVNLNDIPPQSLSNLNGNHLPGPSYLNDDQQLGPSHSNNAQQPGPSHLNDSQNPRPSHLNDGQQPGPSHLNGAQQPGPSRLDDN
jgi:hypothetical protein